MYESFFGLNERAFDLAPNPRFLLMTPTHQEALANIEYGLSGRKGLTLLLGEAGSGKTTLIRAAFARWEEEGHAIAHLNNPTLTREEFFDFLSDSFGFPAAARMSKTRILAELTSFVMQRHAKGLITGLLIDEAQSLSPELLEEVRLLVNIETASCKVFQVILAGQPELATRLNEPELRMIKQRVALRCRLSTLDVREAAAYISGRIQVAGGLASQIFTREAVMTIHHHSGGIPRVINVICDNALLAGFAAGCRPVTRDMVEEVCRDFDLPRIPSAAERRPGLVEVPDQIGVSHAEAIAPAKPTLVSMSGPETDDSATAPANEQSPNGGLFERLRRSSMTAIFSLLKVRL